MGYANAFQALEGHIGLNFFFDIVSRPFCDAPSHVASLTPFRLTHTSVLVALSNHAVAMVHARQLDCVFVTLDGLLQTVGLHLRLAV